MFKKLKAKGEGMDIDNGTTTNPKTKTISKCIV